MSYSNASAIEIDKKLRDDFRRRLKDYGISAELTDPVLAVLFRTFAQQLETLYSQTDRIRLALLDELIANLGFESRMARPAQTIVRFLLNSGSQLIEAGTELIGEAQSGERLTFTTDATLNVSSARIAVAASYQDSQLQILPGIEMPEAFQAVRPSLDAVRVDLGPNPAIFFAVEGLPDNHLGLHSFFFELGPDAFAIQRALETETWCLFGAQGELGAPGILRPKTITGGTQSLQWLIPDEATAENTGRTAADGEKDVPELPAGFYASRLFLLPTIPANRRFTCRVPRGMEPVLTKIFGREFSRLFAPERAWFRVSMPRDIPSLQTSIGNIALHAMAASNVECFNQTIYFEKQGTSIPLQRDMGAASSYPVALLSILGEADAKYLSETEPSSDAAAGRYAIRNGRIELTPALRPDGSRQAYANLRLWVTNGALGNAVGPGGLTGFLKKNPVAGLRMTNPTSAAGGVNQEEFKDAKLRFANALLSRDRIVTGEDLNCIARSFDARILEAESLPTLMRTKHGLRRAEHVRIHVNPDDFLDPSNELRVLKDELTRYLRERSLHGTDLQLEVIEG
jgi:hypothetical protein